MKTDCWLKASTAIAAGMLALLLTGCINPAVSLHPLRTADEKPVAEPGIEGQWLRYAKESKQQEHWEITRDDDGCYKVRAQIPPEDNNKTQVIESYNTCLVRVQEKLFFDSEMLTRQVGGEIVSPNDLGIGVVPVHVMGRIWPQKDLLRVARIDSDWIAKNTPESFHTMNGQTAVIIAGTAELRKVMLEHADETELWGAFDYFCRPGADCEAQAMADGLNRAPDDPEMLQTVAGFYLSRNENDKALELMRHAVQAAPDKPAAHAYLALVLGAKHDFAGARVELARAQQLDKESPEGYDGIFAMAYYMEGNFQEAAKGFARVRAAEKKPTAASLLGSYFSLARGGKRKEADAFLAKEMARFTGSADDHTLLLEAAGRVTDPPWANFKGDQQSDKTFLYAQNCIIQGNLKSARAALEHLISKADDDVISAVMARIELDRLGDKRQ